jgi:hypothetical protein
VPQIYGKERYEFCEVGALILNLNSMYLEKAKGYLLQVSNSGPWKRR